MHSAVYDVENYQNMLMPIETLKGRPGYFQNNLYTLPGQI